MEWLESTLEMLLASETLEGCYRQKLYIGRTVTEGYCKDCIAYTVLHFIHVNKMSAMLVLTLFLIMVLLNTVACFH